jgi:competence/damage-inducible protein CinA-like protein
MSRVNMIAVGDELLEGRTSDTNSGRIQRALGQHAVQVAGIQVVPDDAKAVIRALDLTMAGDIVFMSGGLGSTPDDLTRDFVAEWAGVDLAEDESVRRQLEERWARLGRKGGVGVQRQCQVPAGMTPLLNPVGSAPGLAGCLKERILILLPGVPDELAGLLPSVVRWLADHGHLPEVRQTLLWRTGQIAELSLVRKLEAIRSTYQDLQWSWWLTQWGVDVRIAVDPDNKEGILQLAEIEDPVSRTLGHLVYSREMESLPAVIQRSMIDLDSTLAVAESCTAGMIGACLTDLAGSSAFFRGGIMAYADAIKKELLGVQEHLLLEHGAVSEPVVRAMAVGAKDRLKTDYALAVSGISGPGGGTEEKPVGTTWVAVATPKDVFTRAYRFPGDRPRNRLLTVAAAVDSLRRSLAFGPEKSPWLSDDSWCCDVSGRS